VFQFATDVLKERVYGGITEFRSDSLSLKNLFLAIMMVSTSSTKRLPLLLVLSFLYSVCYSKNLIILLQKFGESDFSFT
jgi:hypothetical protein